MGTGLVGKVYGGVIRHYEGKGPLNIEAEILEFIRSGSVIGKAPITSMPHWGSSSPTGS